MLNIKKNESINEFTIVGVLNEIKVSEGTSNKTNDQYIGIDAQIRVDQEIDGNQEENIIPVKLFSSRHKKDGGLNSNYDRLKGYAEKLQSIGSVDDPSKASRVSLTAKISENSFAGRDGRVVTDWQLSTNFLNNAKGDEDETARFVVTGVVGKKFQELDREGNETGRLVVRLAVIGYNGKANIIDFYASGSKADHIDRYWEQGDTVKAAGIIAVTKKVVHKEEEMGFGDPIVNEYTVPRKELIITKGSRAGLDESESYDADEVKTSIDERNAYIESLKEGAKKSTSAASTKDLGF